MGLNKRPSSSRTMMAQRHPRFATGATYAPPVCRPKPVDGNNGTSIATKRGVHFDKSLAVAHKENQHGAAGCTIEDLRGVDGGHQENPRNILGRGSFCRASLESRLCQHVKYFVNAMGGSMAEGKRLLQLLQVR